MTLSRPTATLRYAPLPIPSHCPESSEFDSIRRTTKTICALTINHTFLANVLPRNCRVGRMDIRTAGFHVLPDSIATRSPVEDS